MPALLQASRASLALLAILVGLVAVTDYTAWSSEQERLLGILEQTGLDSRRPEVARRVEREIDRDWARLRSARALLVDQLDRRWIADLPEVDRAAELARSSERLRLARDLAGDSWTVRPASWQAATIVGGATYLDLTRSRDPRVLAEPALWQEPLRAASELGPGEAQAARFLAAGYLSLWSALTDSEREEVRRLLSAAFHDPDTFGQLIESWLRLAPSLDDAYSVVPETSFAWSRLEGIFSRRNDWQRYVEAHERGRRALLAESERRLDQAERRREGGDLQGARGDALYVATRLPVDTVFAPLFARALTICPPGPFGPRHASKLGVWLGWALELCLYGDCPLPDEVIARLAGSIAGLAEHQVAAAAVAVDKLAQGERYERLSSDAVWSADWGPYFILKARRLLERGEIESALKALRDVHPDWLGSLAFWMTRRQVEMRSEQTGREADALVEAARRTEWPSVAWLRTEGSPRLELLPARVAPGLRIELLEAPARGGAIELLWDGEPQATLEVMPGTTLKVAIPVDTSLHLLELRSIAGGRVLASRVSLLE